MTYQIDLQQVSNGLNCNHSVSEHLGNHPMTTTDEQYYDCENDPGYQLCEAAAVADKIIKTLIKNPILADQVMALVE